MNPETAEMLARFTALLLVLLLRRLLRCVVLVRVGRCWVYPYPYGYPAYPYGYQYSAYPYQYGYDIPLRVRVPEIPLRVRVHTPTGRLLKKTCKIFFINDNKVMQLKSIASPPGGLSGS